jgi:hypothetical protein
MMMMRQLLLLFALTFAVAAAAPARAQVDPLPSWNDGVARSRIIALVRAVTEPGSQGFVPPAERIAVFDNDGTLWAEQPIYFQLAFAIDWAQDVIAKNPDLAKQRRYSRGTTTALAVAPPRLR